MPGALANSIGHGNRSFHSSASLIEKGRTSTVASFVSDDEFVLLPLRGTHGRKVSQPEGRNLYRHRSTQIGRSASGRGCVKTLRGRSSAGVLVPPKGYLERLRALCDKHGILLIFAEVITGFGRLGAPFAVDYFAVRPDLFTTVKGLTNGTIPMGAVFATREIHDAFMKGPENMIELFHGYTYSGHPAACAAGLATLDIYEEQFLLTRGASVAEYWQEAVHDLRSCKRAINIRNIGLVAGIELESRKNAPGARAYDVFLECFARGLLIRVTGDIIALSPPLIVEREQIDTIASVLSEALERID
jgi:beta-alanine--pyruvate transaminase